MDQRQAQGWVARQFVAEDARWVIDTVRSSQHSDAWGAYVALLLSHHFVRIAYEGTLLLRSPNPQVGRKTFAEQLPDQYGAITARARHATKLLDDTQRSYEEVLAEFGEALARSHEVLVADVAWPARWLARDLGLYAMHDRVLGASIPTAYRLGLDPGNSRAMSGQDLTEVTKEWGGTMAFLGSASLLPPLEEGSLVLPLCEIEGRDRRSKNYLRKRYDSVFSLEVKLLLLMIEGDLNVNLNLLPLISAGHAMPIFRARVASLYHSLTAVVRILEHHPTARSTEVQSVTELISGLAAQRILSDGGRRVRNRCVHYEIRDRGVVLDATLPMMGVVEAVFPGQTWESFNEDVLSVTAQLAELLAGWSQG